MSIAVLVCTLIILNGCASLRQRQLKHNAPVAKINIPASLSTNTAEVKDTSSQDTLIIKNIDGKEMIVMKAIRDDDGNMVANQVLEAARVTALFKNVAERHGKINIEFQIIVPEALQNSRWQIRYYPTMFILSDSIKLDKVTVTGKEYRRKQLRGYQQYQRFLDRIIQNDSAFIKKELLEIFLKRNIPQIYSFRQDSTYVSDEQFNSAFGVTKEDAVIHYTDHFARSLNEKRKRMKDSKYKKYVKVPISHNGIRLDTVILSPSGEWIYNYTQTVNTRPRLRKIDIVLDGDIYEGETNLCAIGRSDKLTYYVSSVSAFVDDSPRYMKKIIRRRAEATAAYRIDFLTGRSGLDPSIGKNREIIKEIEGNLRSLAGNSVFEMDSVIVTASASPEGNLRSNELLSKKRSESISRHFRQFARQLQDSLDNEAGIVIDVSEKMNTHIRKEKRARKDIKIISNYIGEDWEAMDIIVRDGDCLNEPEKEDYFSLGKIRDKDTRETSMHNRKWYPRLKKDVYPQLRTVRFTCMMHRKGMIADTLVTTELDTVYMSGVQAIKDRDYDAAIEILRPYNDYNTAVAYCAKDFNHSALSILENCPKNAMVNYMLALVNSRLGEERSAVEYYIRSCTQDSKFIHRGNLDPEINRLIRKYDITF